MTCSTLKSIMAEQALREEGTQTLFEMIAHVSVQDLLFLISNFWNFFLCDDFIVLYLLHILTVF